jgi:hypothetical protein
MMSWLSLSAVLLAVLLVGVRSIQYCAELKAAEAAGASGYVALQVAEGVATYSFELNLNSYKNSTPCDLHDGLKFHIHSYWNSNANGSAANAQCGSSYTGGHYDPNFACSSSSQSISTQCVSLGRVSPSYTYSCNTTVYASGKYSMCEVGDISGKHGTVYPLSTSNLQYNVNNFLDYLPPYTYNYLRQDATSLMWASFVFHCAQNSNRLVCAKFSTTNLSPCQSAFDAMPSDAASTSSSSGISSGALAAAIVVPGLVLLAVGLALGFFVSKKSGILLRSAATNRA